MSSSPTRSTNEAVAQLQQQFQSAVAHELFSDADNKALKEDLDVGFKALSRMSSSPTVEFKALSAEKNKAFQSAVAHELFSDSGQPLHLPSEVIVSKRCRA